MKKICVLAACLVLVASLALPAFAAGVSTITIPYGNNDRVTLDLSYSSFVIKSGGRVSGNFVNVNFPVASKIRVTSISFGSGSHEDVYLYAGDTALTMLPVAGTVYDGVNLIQFRSSYTSGTGTTTLKFDVMNTSVSPSFTNPAGNGVYNVTSLFDVQPVAFMYATKEQPKTFVFSDVTANAGTKVSYAITAEGGSVTYHDIGTLEDGFSFGSADYPVASYFTVRNTGSTPASYTVTVSDAAIDKSSGIALSIWETCLTMGTAAITWITTGTNFIALIPIAMMLLVFAVLCIRKLIKGV